MARRLTCSVCNSTFDANPQGRPPETCSTECRRVVRSRSEANRVARKRAATREEALDAFRSLARAEAEAALERAGIAARR
ncbi:hypothetical protein [Aquipuribacter sp. SD81]|uniref:hypothetical protein n=1 Tax=Aquipuribacter sp. SD81 TaxID=3127703 RepID=UPI00301B4FD2